MRRFLALVIAWLATPGISGAAATNPAAPFKFEPPCSAVIAFAQTNRIPLEGIDALSDTNRLVAGDSVTALVTLFEKQARRTQWLLFLEATEPRPAELPATNPSPATFYSSTGNKLQFESSPAVVTLRTTGPFVAASPKRKAPKVADHTERFTLDQGYLSLGLDRGAAAVTRLQATKGGAEGGFAFGSKPFDDAAIAKGKELAALAKLTQGEERALAGSIPALLSYFQVVQQTRGLEDIMLKVVDLPSFWSILWHVGCRANLIFETKQVGPANPTGWNVPGQPLAYNFPMRLELNDHLAMKVNMVVTTPQPPLLACAGVIGLLAQKPDDAETFLTLRIISARRAGEANAPGVGNGSPGQK